MRASVLSRRKPRHLDVERAAAVDRPGKDLVARLLLDRQRFAGHRRLVDVADPGDDAAVERNLLAGPHDDDIAHAHVVDGNGRERRAAPDERLGGSKIHQRAESRRARVPSRGTRASARPRTGIRRMRPLRPLAERDRAGHGHQHQDVDVEHARPDGVTARLQVGTTPRAIARRREASPASARGPPRAARDRTRGRYRTASRT